jgi:predicted Fe-Mo cluster-binding NifX family protein
MKVALTIWGNKISPVFDSAQTLLVAQVQNNKIIQKQYESFDNDSSGFLCDLKEMGIAVLICGAVSKMSEKIIISSDIKLIPFVSGNAEQVLDLYLTNAPVPLMNLMPGCKQQRYKNGLKNAAIKSKKRLQGEKN